MSFQVYSLDTTDKVDTVYEFTKTKLGYQSPAHIQIALNFGKKSID